MAEETKKNTPGLTIVGGQPRKGKRAGTMSVPVGLEKLLFIAARDDGFKQKLLSDRGAAITEAGVRLRPSEEATLNAIPNAALVTMVEGINPANPRRRKFMGLVAAAATSLAAGTAAVSCDVDDNSTQTRGIDPGTDVDGDYDAGPDGSADTDTVDSDMPMADAGGISGDTNVDGDFENGEQ